MLRSAATSIFVIDSPWCAPALQASRRLVLCPLLSVDPGPALRHPHAPICPYIAPMLKVTSSRRPRLAKASPPHFLSTAQAKQQRARHRQSVHRHIKGTRTPSHAHARARANAPPQAEHTKRPPHPMGWMGKGAREGGAGGRHPEFHQRMQCPNGPNGPWLISCE